MKQLILLSIICFACQNIMSAQNAFGIKAGLSSYDLANSHIASTSDIKFGLKNSKYGFHAGIYGRLGILGVYLQPEILFNSNSVNYKLSDLTTADTIEHIRTSKYQNIDIPVLIMITPSIFKLYAGPVGHYFLNSVSDIDRKFDIKEEVKKLRFGYQFGAGISFSGLTLDFRYEGNFSKQYKTFIIDGQEFKSDDAPSRVLISLWFNL